MRLQYPPTVRIIKLPCTGKLDVQYIMKAFERGADVVFAAGCLEGQCHYLTGNLKAKKRVMYAKKLLDEIGIGGERLEMYNMPASAGPEFAKVVEEMTQRALRLGRNPLFRQAESGESVRV